MYNKYYILLPERISNETFFAALKKKVENHFDQLVWFKLTIALTWEETTPSLTDRDWRLGLPSGGNLSPLDIRLKNVFDCQVMRTGLKYHFSCNVDYWRLYVMLKVSESLAIDFNAKIFSINNTKITEVATHEYKSFLDFLRIQFPKKKKAIRSFYLSELKAMPDEIRSSEGGLKNFL